MTAKFDNFVTELKELCIKHQVVLDFNHDGCDVYDMDDHPQSKTGFWQGFEPEDMTEEK